MYKRIFAVIIAAGVVAAGIFFWSREPVLTRFSVFSKSSKLKKSERPKIPPLDKSDYDRRLHLLANISTKTVTSATTAKPSSPNVKRSGKPKKVVYPKAGALLPFRRIVAFYGNFYSDKMGILGELPEDEVLARLKQETDRWTSQDPTTPALPAIHYIAVVAQGSAGADNKYRKRMPASEIEKALNIAAKANAIVFLDIQIGKSTVMEEVPRLDRYFQMPHVHLGLDPEFSMKGEAKPGQKIGTMDATEINWAINHLSKIVDKYELPPKILVVHRFVPPMITNMALIKDSPAVQVVIDMDGWGTPDEKKKTYQKVITKDHVRFSGFKIFYKNDTRKPNSRLITPEEILELKPKPIYIQYQ